MTPAARVQTAIEILDEIIEATKGDGAAADVILKRAFKQRRYAGSKDRRAIREHVYDAIRRHGAPPQSGRAAMIGLAGDERRLREAFDGSDYGPQPIMDGEAGEPASNLPEWLRDRFDPALNHGDILALSDRAPLDIRINRSKIGRDEALQRLGSGEPGRLSDRAIRLPSGFPVEQHDLFHEGLIDIQDEGSQLVADAAGAERGMTVVDLCAGAGGKTLAIHDRVEGRARFIACDTDRQRIRAFAPRAERTGIEDVETRLLNPGREREVLGDLRDTADLVLIDTPCSGTGTWRRNPEARWRLTPERIGRIAALQAHILDYGADLVRPGGHLLYAVCSLLHEEGEGQISAFLARRSDFRKVEPAIDHGIVTANGRLLSPARHGTDGFFFARLQRAC